MNAFERRLRLECARMFGRDWIGNDEASRHYSSRMKSYKDVVVSRKDFVDLSNPLLLSGVDRSLWYALSDTWLTTAQWLDLCRRGLRVRKVLVCRPDGSFVSSWPVRPFLHRNSWMSSGRHTRRLP